MINVLTHRTLKIAERTFWDFSLSNLIKVSKTPFSKKILHNLRKYHKQLVINAPKKNSQSIQLNWKIKWIKTNRANKNRTKAPCRVLSDTPSILSGRWLVPDNIVGSSVYLSLLWVFTTYIIFMMFGYCILFFFYFLREIYNTVWSNEPRNFEWRRDSFVYVEPRKKIHDAKQRRMEKCSKGFFFFIWSRQT